MSTQSDLAELYTTFFNRAPDATGLTYWVNEISTGKLTLAQVAKNWTTQQAEGLASLPSTLSNTQFIDKIYGNILGRTADTSGATYWLNQLNSGAVTRDTFALSVINGAKANTTAQGVLDTTLINNKAAVGVAFANKGVNDTTLAAKVLTSVTANADTLASTLAVISLLPATSAAQTPAVLASANAVLTKFAALITAAPGEVADAATYLKALVAGVSSTTNIGTLLDNANTLLTSAATNSAALDNPAAQGAAAVVVATPSTGGGSTPATFVATENTTTHVLNFTGTATGDITITSLTANDVVFSRGGIAAASVPLATVTGVQDTAPLSLTVSQFSALNGLSIIQAADSIKIIDTAANITAGITVLAANAALIDTIDASDTATITLNQAQLTAITSAKLTTGDTITLSDNTLTGAQAAILGADANIDFIRAASLTLTNAQYTAASAKLNLNDNIVVNDNTLTGATAAVLGADAKVDSIRATALTVDLTQYAAVLAKLDMADSITVADNTLTATQINTLGSVSVVDFIRVANQTLSNAQYTNASAKLSALDSITVNDNGLTGAQIGTLGADAKVDFIFANSQTLTAPQFSAAAAKLSTANTINIVDTGANLATALGSLVTNATVVDSIDATDNVLTLTAVQGATLGVKLTAADVVTFTNTTGQTTQTIAGGFQSGTDKLQFTATELVSGGFVTYTGGNTKVDFTGGSAEFVSGAGAVASSGQAAFLFNTTTNTLSYDADGTGAGAAVTLLVLTGVPSLAVADLSFV